MDGIFIAMLLLVISGIVAYLVLEIHWLKKRQAIHYKYLKTLQDDLFGLATETLFIAENLDPKHLRVDMVMKSIKEMDRK